MQLLNLTQTACQGLTFVYFAKASVPSEEIIITLTVDIPSEVEGHQHLLLDAQGRLVRIIRQLWCLPALRGRRIGQRLEYLRQVAPLHPTVRSGVDVINFFLCRWAPLIFLEFL